jgi:hypothetical protein
MLTETRSSQLETAGIAVGFAPSARHSTLRDVGTVRQAIAQNTTPAAPRMRFAVSLHDTMFSLILTVHSAVGALLVEGDEGRESCTSQSPETAVLCCLSTLQNAAVLHSNEASISS